MIDETGTEPTAADRRNEPTPERVPPPISERQQPDPMLQLSTDRMGAAGITLVAVAVVAILAVVLYGLNTPDTAEHTAGAPPATQSAKPPAGGSSGPAAPEGPRSNESGVKG